MSDAADREPTTTPAGPDATSQTSCPEYDRFAEFYDHVTPYRLREDVAFFVDLALQSRGPVLEMACGTGRVLIPSARAGATMVGADLSLGMLDACRAKLTREPAAVRQRVSLHHADMRRFDLGQTFELITIPFRGFQHLLTVDDQRAALQCLRSHLSEGGRLVLDVFNPSLQFLGDERWLVNPLVEPEFTMPDGRRVVRSFRITRRDYANQVQEMEMAYEVTWPGGRTERNADAFAMRYVFRYEAEHLLEREGFRVDAVYGDYDKTPFGTRYPGEIILIGTRR
jgi:SAM-dependent methyltransferase